MWAFWKWANQSNQDKRRSLKIKIGGQRWEWKWKNGNAVVWVAGVGYPISFVRLKPPWGGGSG